MNNVSTLANILYEKRFEIKLLDDFLENHTVTPMERIKIRDRLDYLKNWVDEIESVGLYEMLEENVAYYEVIESKINN